MIPTPGIDDILWAAKASTNPAPGPEGIPYVPWRQAGLRGAHTLLGVLCESSMRNFLPGLNEQLAIFLPKDCGEEEEGVGVSATRGASDTRPLSFKNSDIRICTSVVNHKIKKVIANRANSCQRGFISGRLLHENIAEIDAAMRIHGQAPRNHLLSVGGFFDFRAAFPSMSQKQFFAVFKFLQLPLGLICFMMAIYHENVAMCRGAGECLVLYCIVSGILQDRPASGSLFILAVDAPLNSIQDVVERGDGRIVRACADDVGFGLRELASLRPLHKCYVEIQALILLTLKPPKCNIVPSGE